MTKYFTFLSKNYCKRAGDNPSDWDSMIYGPSVALWQHREFFWVRVRVLQQFKYGFSFRSSNQSINHQASVALVMPPTPTIYFIPLLESFGEDYTVLGISRAHQHFAPFAYSRLCSHDAPFTVHPSCTVIHFIHFIVAWTMIKGWRAGGEWRHMKSPNTVFEPVLPPWRVGNGRGAEEPKWEKATVVVDSCPLIFQDRENNQVWNHKFIS